MDLNSLNEVLKIGIGIVVLILGIPIGDILAKMTKEELKSGQVWFKLIVVVSLIVGFLGLIIGNDFLLFGFFRTRFWIRLFLFFWLFGLGL